VKVAWKLIEETELLSFSIWKAIWKAIILKEKCFTVTIITIIVLVKCSIIVLVQCIWSLDKMAFINAKDFNVFDTTKACKVGLTYYTIKIWIHQLPADFIIAPNQQ
jgi:hypothetical protein